MKYVSILAVLFLASFAFAAYTPTNVQTAKIDHPGSGGTFTFQGGEDIGTATVIPSLPYYDTGTTMGAVNDYDEVCPYSGSTSPDVVYSYTPGADGFIKVDLCDSYYDTKVYVYENGAGYLVACNDDYCSGPNYPYSFLSFVDEVPVFAGNTYYIVVDGYGLNSGDYIIKVDVGTEPPPPPEPCDVICPAGAILEGEPVCGPGYDDSYNGGCNSTPIVFQTLTCGDDPLVVCGESGTWYDYNYMRDTDWYEIVLTEPKDLAITACAEFELLTFWIIPMPDCYTYSLSYVVSDPYFTNNHSIQADPGTYWYWVGCADFYSGTPCGARYVFSIEGWCPSTATEETSWGSVKEMFR